MVSGQTWSPALACQVKESCEPTLSPKHEKENIKLARLLPQVKVEPEPCVTSCEERSMSCMILRHALSTDQAFVSECVWWSTRTCYTRDGTRGSGKLWIVPESLSGRLSSVRGWHEAQI